VVDVADCRCGYQCDEKHLKAEIDARLQYIVNMHTFYLSHEAGNYEPQAFLASQFPGMITSVKLAHY
jgi:hypothetical protein